MVLIALDNDMLNQLCSEDQPELLNAVDDLRSQGIDSYVSLPQIIVCGDQSSERVLCWRQSRVYLFPSKATCALVFRQNWFFVKLRKLEWASQSSQIPLTATPKAIPWDLSTRGLIPKTFSKNLLRIEVSGPDRPQLTIVDLPGLIYSETKQQSAADIELVQEIVESYMEEPRSIILAVISAKNDYANQIVS